MDWFFSDAQLRAAAMQVLAPRGIAVFPPAALRHDVASVSFIAEVHSLPHMKVYKALYEGQMLLAFIYSDTLTHEMQLHLLLKISVLHHLRDCAHLSALVAAAYLPSLSAPPNVLVLTDHWETLSLRDIAMNELLHWHARIQLAWQVAYTLQLLHGLGIVHKEVESELVWVRNGQQVVMSAEFMIFLSSTSAADAAYGDQFRVAAAVNVQNFGILLADIVTAGRVAWPMECALQDLLLGEVMESVRAAVLPDCPLALLQLVEQCCCDDSARRISAADCFRQLTEFLAYGCAGSPVTKPEAATAESGDWLPISDICESSLSGAEALVDDLSLSGAPALVCGNGDVDKQALSSERQQCGEVNVLTEDDQETQASGEQKGDGSDEAPCVATDAPGEDSAQERWSSLSFPAVAITKPQAADMVLQTMLQVEQRLRKLEDELCRRSPAFDRLRVGEELANSSSEGKAPPATVEEVEASYCSIHTMLERLRHYLLCTQDVPSLRAAGYVRRSLPLASRATLNADQGVLSEEDDREERRTAEGRVDDEVVTQVLLPGAATHDIISLPDVLPSQLCPRRNPPSISSQSLAADPPVTAHESPPLPVNCGDGRRYSTAYSPRGVRSDDASVDLSLGEIYARPARRARAANDALRVSHDFLVSVRKLQNAYGQRTPRSLQAEPWHTSSEDMSEDNSHEPAPDRWATSGVYASMQYHQRRANRERIRGVASASQSKSPSDALFGALNAYQRLAAKGKETSQQASHVVQRIDLQIIQSAYRSVKNSASPPSSRSARGSRPRYLQGTASSNAHSTPRRERLTEAQLSTPPPAMASRSRMKKTYSMLGPEFQTWTHA